MAGTYPRDRFGHPLPRGSRDELAHAEVPEEVVGSAREAWHKGIALFDEQRFFEAHEFFEYAWKADDVEDRDRPFLKGVTQLAVGCCHAQRENSQGALALLNRAVENLRAGPPVHRGIDSVSLVAVALDVARRIRESGASAALDFPGFPKAAA